MRHNQTRVRQDYLRGQAMVEYAILLMTFFFAVALVVVLIEPILANGFLEVVNALANDGNPSKAPSPGNPIPPPPTPTAPPPTPTSVAGNNPQPVWRFDGFYLPLEMGGIFNTVKGGSTVALKFELFEDEIEQTSPSVVGPLTATQISCTTFEEESIIDPGGAGATNLRYDSATGQFIYNWKTPKVDGVCYKVEVSATDGASLVAYFKLKDKAA